MNDDAKTIYKKLYEPDDFNDESELVDFETIKNFKNEITDCIEITPKVFNDKRGYFFESFNLNKFSNIVKNFNTVFVQDNESCSSKYVIRGLHYQKGEFAQAKLVRVIKGSVIDFVLDIRENSKTYGKMKFVYLSGENKKQFYIPRGFAHGFVSLEDNTIFAYKCDNYWNKESEAGYNILDEKLNIIPTLNKILSELSLDPINNPVFSDKDCNYPNFSKINN